MSTVVLGCLISPTCRMVLLPFPLASSLLIVSYYVSSFEPFHVLRGGSLFLSFVPSSVRSAVRHVSAYRLAGSSMRRGVLLLARHIGKQTDAFRLVIVSASKQRCNMASRRRLARHAVLPIWSVVRAQTQHERIAALSPLLIVQHCTESTHEAPTAQARWARQELQQAIVMWRCLHSPMHSSLALETRHCRFDYHRSDHDYHLKGNCLSFLYLCLAEGTPLCWCPAIGTFGACFGDFTNRI